MAPIGLDDLSNELILDIADWIDAVVAIDLKRILDEVNESYNGENGYDRPAEAFRKAAGERRSRLRFTLENASCISHRFRLLLAPRLFSKSIFKKAYTEDKVTAFIETMESSAMLRACLMDLHFEPFARGKIKDDEFTSTPRLVLGFQGFRNLSRLCFALPRGRVTNFKRELSAGRQPLFPTVEDLNIPYDGHYILTHCPKVHKLTIHCHRWYHGLSDPKKHQKWSAQFRAEMIRFGKTLRKCEASDVHVKTLCLEFRYKSVLPSMLHDLIVLFPKTDKFVVGSYFKKSDDIVKQLADALSVGKELRFLELPHFWNILIDVNFQALAQSGPSHKAGLLWIRSKPETEGIAIELFSAIATLNTIAFRGLYSREVEHTVTRTADLCVL